MYNKVFIKDLHRSLSDISKLAHFMLLIIQEKTETNLILKKLEMDGLLFRYVDMFADDSNTRHGGDIQGWNDVLDEFKLK